MGRQEVSEGRIDLHLHSLLSDGFNTVKEIVDLALNREKLSVIAITDHNCFALTQKYIVGADGHLLEVLPGCEFSTTYVVPGGNRTEEIHVIGLFPKGVNPQEFQDLFDPIAEGKKRYIAAILDQLHELGIDLSMEEVMKVKRETGYVGRFQIAEILVNKGYGRTVDEIMDRYIGNYSPYYISATNYVKYADFRTVIQRIQMNAGFPVLCHPYSYHQMSENEVLTLIHDFKEAAGGVGGLEVYYLEYTEEQQASLRKLADEAHLIPSVASDRHRKDQPFADLGGYSFYMEMLKAL